MQPWQIRLAFAEWITGLHHADAIDEKQKEALRSAEEVLFYITEGLQKPR